MPSIDGLYFCPGPELERADALGLVKDEDEATAGPVRVEDRYARSGAWVSSRTPESQPTVGWINVTVTPEGVQWSCRNRFRGTDGFNFSRPLEAGDSVCGLTVTELEPLTFEESGQEIPTIPTPR